MKSLNDLVQKYPFSRITLQRRMKLIPDFKKKYCKRGKYNKLFVNDTGVKMITYEKHNSTSNHFHTKRGTNSNQLTKSDLINTVHQLLDLNKGLKARNARLRHNADNKARVMYHEKDLPSPVEWREQSKIVKHQQRYIDYLKSKMNNMSFTDWFRSRF